jgi:stage II sporulation protein M
MAGYGSLIWSGRRWITIAVLLFIFGCVAGYVAASAEPQRVSELIQPIVERLGGIGERIVRSGSAYERTWILFQNNVGAVLAMIAGGVVFGLLPAYGSLQTGAVLGIVTGLGSLISPAAASPRLLVLSILPHAIFELPAVWLASAWGMKLGLAWLAPSAEGRRGEVFRATAAEAAQVFALAVVLLFIAAAVEANLTLSLVRSA